MKKLNPFITKALVISGMILIASVIIAFLLIFTKSTTNQVSDFTEKKLYCINNVFFEIVDVCQDKDTIKIRIKNDKSPLKGFLIRSYQNPQEAELNDISHNLEPFQIDSINYKIKHNITLIEMVAKIDQNTICTEKKVSFENLKNC
jgi:hypothetical protein